MFLFPRLELWIELIHLYGKLQMEVMATRIIEDRQISPCYLDQHRMLSVARLCIPKPLLNRWLPSPFLKHRIIETLRLENTTKITLSNHQSTHTMPANHDPQCHICMVLVVKSAHESGLQHSRRSLFQHSTGLAFKLHSLKFNHIIHLLHFWLLSLLFSIFQTREASFFLHFSSFCFVYWVITFPLFNFFFLY